MNKQEAIEKIKSEKILGGINSYGLGYNEALDEAIYIVKQLDEPEKPVLSKEEAEWVDKLTNCYSLSDALYYITRCGYGYLLVFEIAHETYELPVESDTPYGEMCRLKERLVNAVVYGYEVEKEKLYTVSLKKSGIGIGVQQQDGSFKEQFTKTELSEYGFDSLDEYEIEEVKE